MSPCISFGIWRQCFPEFLLRRARARRKSPRILLDPYWGYHLVPTIRQSKIAKDKSTVQRDMVPLKMNIFRSSLLVYRKIIQIYQEKSPHLSKLRFPCLDVWNKKKTQLSRCPRLITSLRDSSQPWRWQSICIGISKVRRENQSSGLPTIHVNITFRMRTYRYSKLILFKWMTKICLYNMLFICFFNSGLRISRIYPETSTSVQNSQELACRNMVKCIKRVMATNPLSQNFIMPERSCT